MWFKNVNIPQSLVEAHRDGSLVLFVGAGASIDPPSNLPDFDTLAKEIVEGAHKSIRESERGKPDVLLGRLVDRECVGVHKLVAKRIADPDSKPSLLHQAICALASADSKARIVTTNYDLHLTATLKKRTAGFEVYKGPALPLGNDFSGLVYLHGNVSQRPSRLVITDSDIGRAYLQDAWAARFLERMFAEYTVLFIGYSHDDVMMRHIARALGQDNDRRYVLVGHRRGEQSGLDDDKWKQYGVRPIPYPIIEESRHELHEGIASWATLAAMGMTDHKERVREIVSNPPPSVPEDVSYLEDTFWNAEKARFFAEFAKGSEWLTWVVTNPTTLSLFAQLFRSEASSEGDLAGRLKASGATSGEIERMLSAAPTVLKVLAGWFVKHYVLDQDLSPLALDVAKKVGGRLSRPLWMALDQQIGTRRPWTEWLNPWLVLTIENAGDLELRRLSWMLTGLQWAKDREVAMLLFDCLTEPRQVSHPSVIGRCFRGYEYSLSKAWRDLFKPNLSEAAREILVIVDHHLRRLNRLLTVVNANRPEGDVVSYYRSAIEPHEQDKQRRDWDVLIDSARDCLEELLRSGDPVALRYLQAWSESNVLILRRLATHGWTQREDLDGTAKIEWLLSTGWLFDEDVWHETCRLMAEALPSADTDMADLLVEKVQGGPSDISDEGHRLYESFLLLGWITCHAPGLESARAAFARIQTEHPSWKTRKYPDFKHWIEIGDFIPPRPPMSVVELHELIVNDTNAAVAGLGQYETHTSPWEDTTWQGVLAMLAETVQENPDDGFLVLDATGGDHADIVRYVVRGWSNNTLSITPETADRIANRLTQVDLTSAKKEIASLLSGRWGSLAQFPCCQETRSRSLDDPRC